MSENILDKSKKITEVYDKLRKAYHKLDTLKKFKSFNADCNLNMSSSSESTFFTGTHKELLLIAMIFETKKYMKSLEDELRDILTNNPT